MTLSRSQFFGENSIELDLNAGEKDLLEISRGKASEVMATYDSLMAAN